MKSPKINEIIFRELLKRGYSLEGKTRIWNIADSKLWYITPEQAQAFLDLEKSPEYVKDIMEKEMELIRQNLDEIIRKVGEGALNIIDLGCGDGRKAAIFIDHLKNKGKKDMKIRYCPIDISSYMVERAIDRLSKMNVDEIVQFQWNISDFENIENISSLLRQGEFKKNFILLLGNTLGNFEIHELLYSLKNGMEDEDYILIGNGLGSKESEDIVKAYDNKFIDNLLIKTLLQIGIKKEDVKYGARFKNSRIEMYYTIKKDIKIKFLDKEVLFNKGDQILVAVSYKYTEYDLMSHLKMYFREVDMYTPQDKSYAVALCKK